MNRDLILLIYLKHDELLKNGRIQKKKMSQRYKQFVTHEIINRMSSLRKNSKRENCVVR